MHYKVLLVGQTPKSILIYMSKGLIHVHGQTPVKLTWEPTIHVQGLDPDPPILLHHDNPTLERCGATLTACLLSLNRPSKYLQTIIHIMSPILDQDSQDGDFDQGSVGENDSGTGW